jgi:two-component system, chemotaxis family, response regulator Rcp1
MNRPIEILLIEDNPGDVRLTQESMREGQVANVLRVARDGVEAMRMLRREGPYGEIPTPDLILLDLNLPRMDGRAVLREVKGHLRLRLIPVIVLTSSEAPEDVVRSYELHANCYVTKPVLLDRFLAVARHIEEFWLRIAKLPLEART